MALAEVSYPLVWVIYLSVSLSLCTPILSSGFDFSPQIRKDRDEDEPTMDLKLELLHRDSPGSPFYDGSASRLKLFQNAVHRSMNRAVKMFGKLSHEDANGDGNYLSPVTPFPSEGDYVTSLSLGSPPQAFSTLFADTGSTLVWVKCSNSSANATRPSQLNISRSTRADRLFDEYRSQTYTNMTCSDPICAQLQQDTGVPNASCPNPSSSPCPFEYSYADFSGESGVMAYDNLNLQRVGGGMEKLEHFAFGCAPQSAGISGDGGVGLDRGSYSLITQLGSRIGYKFSYCLTPMESNVSSSIFFGKSASVEGKDVMHTPLLHPNNTGRRTYYVGVRRIYLGSRRLPIPYKAFQIRGGVGGTVMDSGTTLVLLASPAYEALVLELLTKIPYPQVFYQSFFQNILCFDISSAEGHPDLPGLTFVLKEGARLHVPWENLFYPAGKDVVCLAVQQSPSSIQGLSIIGNMAQQNYNILYDLKNNRMSFVGANCSEVN